jgi:CheY-like chemotaxis protein
MSDIPCITRECVLVDRIATIVASCRAKEDTVTPIFSAEDALEYLSLEMPDLVLVDFSDPHFDGFTLLERMMQDAWLLHSSVIALCGDDEDTAERLETMRGANIVIHLHIEDLERRLPTVLDIVGKNKRILFQRMIGGDLQTFSGSYQLANDTIEANCYVNLVCNYLYSASKIDAEGKMSVHLALTEMLLNAIEHGNCGITYEEKGAWLEDGGSMSALIERKCADPAIRAKRVQFEYTISPTQSSFHIRDEGPGFDWRTQKDAAHAERTHDLHGRGIRMTRKYTKNLRYNEQGNEVFFEVEHARDCVNAMPAAFENLAPVPVHSGDVIFREGESGGFLYFIAKGTFDVLVQGATVDTLSADDIFMGEMSFLRNNRRSATVRATGDGKLLRISKRDFVAAIKRKPHYALFLSRLLAQRLQRRNSLG